MSKPTVVSMEQLDRNFQTEVRFTMSDGSKVPDLCYYADEISFTEQELVGLTREQVTDLYHKKDIQYFQS